jgi:hypothetical protein
MYYRFRGYFGKHFNALKIFNSLLMNSTNNNDKKKLNKNKRFFFLSGMVKKMSWNEK